MGRRRKITETNANDTSADVVISDARLSGRNAVTDAMNENAKKLKPKRVGITKGKPFNLITLQSGSIDTLEKKMKETLTKHIDKINDRLESIIEND